MREEYDIDQLNPRPNPYAKELKKQVTIKLSYKATWLATHLQTEYNGYKGCIHQISGRQWCEYFPV